MFLLLLLTNEIVLYIKSQFQKSINFSEAKLNEN